MKFMTIVATCRPSSAIRDFTQRRLSRLNLPSIESSSSAVRSSTRLQIATERLSRDQRITVLLPQLITLQNDERDNAVVR